MAREKAKKKQFKMPHLLWIMLGMLIVCSILTYIIPAGQFATDADGRIVGDQFSFLGYRTPVNIIEALLLILPGLVGSAPVIFTVMVSGAAIEVFLATKSFDKLIDWSIRKLDKQGDMLMISILFVLMAYLGAFGGTDALIAIIPLGIVFAQKLHLDAICALGVTLFATQIGFGTGPTKVYVVQGLMGTRMYGGFITRFVIMNIFIVLGLIMLRIYVKAIRKDPSKSVMYKEGWRPETVTIAEEKEIETASLSWRNVVNLILFFGQYILITIYGLVGNSSRLFQVTVTVTFVVAIINGIVAGMSADVIGNTFAKGLANMAFVCVVIGLARSVSLVLGNGNVLHTIVYALTLPLMNLPRWISSVGMTIIIALINPIIPSATSKAAILVPILKPIGEVLALQPEVVVQAFQFGDGFTNLVSPILGWTVGGIAMAKVAYPDWVKWALPKVITFILVGCVIMFILTSIGWTFAI